MRLVAGAAGKNSAVRWRAPLLALILVFAAGIGWAAPARAAVPVLVIDGRGFGHGVGMAQDGAYWMGRAGASANDIIRHFYPRTALGPARGDVRVAVLNATSPDVDVTFPDGGELRDAPSGAQSPGFPLAVAPGGTAHLHYDGRTYTAS